MGASGLSLNSRGCPLIISFITFPSQDVSTPCCHSKAFFLSISRKRISFAGMVPEEMFGRTSFPPIGELPYLLTLAPRGFFWFRLRQQA